MEVYMRKSVIALLLIPCFAQGGIEKIYDYMLLGPKFMRDVQSLSQKSLDRNDYDALQEKVLDAPKPWYIRLLTFFEPREERKIERLWYRVQKQLVFILELKKQYEDDVLLKDIFEQVNRVQQKAARVLDAPVPVGALTKESIYKRSKQLLGEVIFNLLEIYANLGLVTSPTILPIREVLMKNLQEVMEMQKAYDTLNFSAVERWYMSQVDKQFESYLIRLFRTIELRPIDQYSFKKV